MSSGRIIRLVIMFVGALLAVGASAMAGYYAAASPRGELVYHLEIPEERKLGNDRVVMEEDVLLLPEGEHFAPELLRLKKNGEETELSNLQFSHVNFESSDPEVVSVDEEGSITALSAGTARITAELFKTVVSFDVRVYKPLEGIELAAEEFDLIVGESCETGFRIFPEDAELFDEVHFDVSNENVASVDEDGTIVAQQKGVSRVSAELGGFRASADITAVIPLEGIAFHESELIRNVGEAARMSLDLEPADATLPKSVTYSVSDESLAEIDERGAVKVLQPGTVQIFAEADGFHAEAEMTIYAPLKGIKLNKKSYVLVGLSDSVRAKVIYDPENTTDDKTVKWSSDDKSVVTVDKKGNLTPVGPGSCTIKAKVGEYTAKAKVTVEIPLEAIGFGFESLTIHYGDSVQLPIGYYPENTTADLTTEWTSSDESVASVDAQGVVTALGAGTTVITASSNGLSASVTISVDVPVTAVNISAAEMTLNKGMTGQLTASVYPEFTTEEPYITWSSDNTYVATVDENGVVTAVGAGICTITANHDFIGASCIVTVFSPLKGIYFEQDTLTLIEGYQGKLTVGYDPIDTTDDRSISWSSENPAIATVDWNGVVKAVSAGTTRIRAVVGAQGAYATIHVAPFIQVNAVSLNTNSLRFKAPGEQQRLTATVSPANATQRSVSWTSSNSGVATVNGEGVVTAVGAGSCTITVTAGSKSAACQVTVASKNRVVVIDPGHCNVFRGASYNGMNEENLTLKTAFYCKEYLESHFGGVTVYMTRYDGSNLGANLKADLEARAQVAQNYQADILVSLHFNATAAHNARGCLAFVSYQPNVAAQSAELANQILARISALGIRNLGLVSARSDQYFDPYGNPLDYYAINRHCANRGIPGIIVEHCFLDTEPQFCNSDAKLQALGAADAEGIAAYLGLPRK